MNDTNPFGITKEEILSLAAQKLADEYSDHESLTEQINKLVTSRIELAVKASMLAKVDQVIMEEVQKLLRTEIVPVNIWGEKSGSPTTIRAALSDRAQKFWSEKVDGEGRVSESYSSKPRHEWLFQKIVGEEFQAVVKQNMVNLVAAFKDAMRTDAQKQCDEYLNQLIKVKSMGDKK